ncbi:MAG: DUF1801 domain-containing protein [Sedimentisphaerales bacterium]|nr:DUF1801 domain-containing protein [Sedimentisphaerales bacterium]
MTTTGGMICYEVPLRVFGKTYNGQPLMYAALAAQKQYNAIYLTNVYCDDTLRERLVAGFERAGKKLNMGKSCVRFKHASDLPLDTIGSIVAATSVEQFVAFYQASRGRTYR